MLNWHSCCKSTCRRLAGSVNGLPIDVFSVADAVEVDGSDRVIDPVEDSVISNSNSVSFFAGQLDAAVRPRVGLESQKLGFEALQDG